MSGVNKAAAKYRTSTVFYVPKKVPIEFPIYQFGITLNTKTPVWRRIHLSSNKDFYAFHRAIISAMGWGGSREIPHEFTMKNPYTDERERIGNASDGVVDEFNAVLSQYFSTWNTEAVYIYDDVDQWRHEIMFEGVLPNDGALLPRCIGGKMACPPDKCGGVAGFDRLLEILDNPNDPEYAEKRKWIEQRYYLGKYDHQFFDYNQVFFS